MPVAVRGLVERTVGGPRRERVDRDAPVELAVVGARAHRVKAWIEPPGQGAELGRRSNARQRREAPVGAPELWRHREAGGEDGDDAAGDDRDGRGVAHVDTHTLKDDGS